MQQLSAIAVNGAGSGTIIEHNQIHDGIGAIVIENTARTYIHHNKIQNMTHFGVVARCGVNGSISGNSFSDVNEPLRFQDLNVACETAPRAISIYNNTSNLPTHVGEHVFFHWLPRDSANPDPPPHNLDFYRNKFCGGYVTLVVNGEFDSAVGLGGSQFIGNVFEADYFMRVFAPNVEIAQMFHAKVMIEAFRHNRVAVTSDDVSSPHLPSVFAGKNRPLWFDDQTNTVMSGAPPLSFGCLEPIPVLSDFP